MGRSRAMDGADEGADGGAEHGVENVPHTHRRERSGGLILCGGLSSRMGFEKARLRFPGGGLLERVLGRMREVVSPVVLSLAPGQVHPALPPEVMSDVMAVEDSAPGQGPLQGLLEGFRALDGRCGRVLVMAVDMPFFTPPWMTRLLDGLGGSEGNRACMFEYEGFVNALTAAYEMALLPKLERLVDQGLRRPIFLGRDEPARIIPIGEEEIAKDKKAAGKDPSSGSGGHPLTDVDTPQAYREALLHEGVGTQGGAAVTVEIELPGRATGEQGFAALYAVTAGEALEFSLRLYPECAGVGEFASPNSQAGRGGILRIRGDGNKTALAQEARLEPGDRLLLGFDP